MSKAEKFIQEHTKNCSNEMESPLYANPKLDFYPWITPDQARKAVEIAREEMIEWIEENIGDYIDLRCANPTTFCVINGDKLVTDLKQAVKDE